MTRRSSGGVLNVGEVVRVKLVAYSCDAPEHPPGSMPPDKLTVHQGEWAFCACDARADGHRWQKTGGASYEDLMRHVGLALTLPIREVTAKP
jgi:hypothetical protein